MKWPLFDIALTWVCVALLVHFGGLPAGFVGTVWAGWNYADGSEYDGLCFNCRGVTACEAAHGIGTKGGDK